MDKDSIKLLSIFSIIYGIILSILSFILFLALSLLPFDGGSVLLLIPITGFICSILIIIAGINLNKFKSWARKLIIIISFPSLINIPLGTAFGIYALICLFDKNVKSYFK